jgi:hypothetical protein
MKRWGTHGLARRVGETATITRRSNKNPPRHHVRPPCARAARGGENRGLRRGARAFSLALYHCCVTVEPAHVICPRSPQRSCQDAG